jgi:heme/copper-type cytochrome/quinol oxidase subunit 3
MAIQAHESNEPEVYFQYEDIDQQQDTYLIGMWAFLAQELLFFGAIFFIYFLYRPELAARRSQHCDPARELVLCGSGCTSRSDR